MRPDPRPVRAHCPECDWAPLVDATTNVAGVEGRHRLAKHGTRPLDRYLARDLSRIHIIDQALALISMWLLDPARVGTAEQVLHRVLRILRDAPEAQSVAPGRYVNPPKQRTRKDPS